MSIFRIRGTVMAPTEVTVDVEAETEDEARKLFMGGQIGDLSDHDEPNFNEDSSGHEIQPLSIDSIKQI